MDIRTPVKTIYGDHYERFAELWRNQAEKLKEKFGSKVKNVLMPQKDLVEVLTLEVDAATNTEVLQFLKSEPGFDYGFLADITATDELEFESQSGRFRVVYHLFSHSSKARIRLVLWVGEGQSVKTAVGVWLGANWAEREIFDMFGIRFEGHPDLRRILMDERWVGHPLRKDYPLRGYQLFTEPEQAHEELLK